MATSMVTDITFMNISSMNVTGPPSFEFNVHSGVTVVFGTLITLMTIGGQIVVFLVVSRDVRLRDANTYYITSLAVADLLISLISVPIWTMYTTIGYWPFPQIYCDIWNMLDCCLCSVSINTIFFISVDRYLCLRYPFVYPLKRTNLISKLALVIIWAITASVYTTYIGVTQVLFDEGGDIYQCNTNYLNSIAMTFITVALLLWVPIFGTMVMYVKIYRIAAKVAAATAEITVGTISGGGTGERNDAPKSGQDGMKAVKTIGLLLLTFVLCWLPLTFGFLLTAIYHGDISPWLLVVSFWLGYVNSMLNPVCYALGNPYFKETLKKMFGVRNNLA